MRWLFIPLILLLAILSYSPQPTKTNLQSTLEVDSCSLEKPPISQASPYDTLCYNTLILHDKKQQQLLRAIKKDSLVHVLPAKYQTLIKNTAIDYEITEIQANNNELMITGKGSFEENLSISNVEFIRTHFKPLSTTIKDYGSFDYKTTQVYSWDAATQQYSSKYQTIDVDIYELLPKRIDHNFYPQKDSFQWEAPFDSIAVFKKLIPGHFVERSPAEFEMNAVFWACDKCPKNQAFYDYFDTIPVNFPFKDGVQSRFQQAFSFTNSKGKAQKLLYFSSSEELDYALSGRFAKGYMGFALFEQQDSIWQLQYFNPTVNYLGMFQSPPLFEKINLGGTTAGFLAEDNIGGNGWFHYGETYLYHFIDDEFKIILQIPFSSRSNDISSWETTVLNHNSEQAYADLEVLIRGTIDTTQGLKTFPDFEAFSPKLAEAFPKHKVFDFIILQRYQWDKRQQKYKLKKEKLTLTKPGA